MSSLKYKLRKLLPSLKLDAALIKDREVLEGTASKKVKIIGHARSATGLGLEVNAKRADVDAWNGKVGSEPENCEPKHGKENPFAEFLYPENIGYWIACHVSRPARLS